MQIYTNKAPKAGKALVICFIRIFILACFCIHVLFQTYIAYVCIPNEAPKEEEVVVFCFRRCISWSIRLYGTYLQMYVYLRLVCLWGCVYLCVCLCVCVSVRVCVRVRACVCARAYRVEERSMIRHSSIVGRSLLTPAALPGTTGAPSRSSVKQCDTNCEASSNLFERDGVSVLQQRA